MPPKTKSASQNRPGRAFTEPTDYISAKVQVYKGYPDLIQNETLNAFLATNQNPEIRLDAAALDDSRSALRLKRLASVMKKNQRKVTVHGPFMNLCPGGTDRLIRKVTTRRIAQTLKAAAVLEPEYVVFHADFLPWLYGSHPDVWLKNSLSTWEEAIFTAQALGLTILLENTYEKSPEQLMPLMENLAHPRVGFLLDVGHIHGLGGGTAKEWLTAMSPYLRAIHLHDNHGPGHDEHLALGEGVVDFEALRLALNELRLNPLLVLEVKHPEQAAASLQYLANNWRDRF